MLTNELVTVGLFALLVVVVLVLIDALRKTLPLLHDSISSKNIAPLYQTLLPVAKQGGKVAVNAVMAELERRAAQTSTTLDDQMVKLLKQSLESVLADIPAQGE